MLRGLLLAWGAALLLAVFLITPARQDPPISASRVVIASTSEGYHLYVRWWTREIYRKLYKRLTRRACASFCTSMAWSPDGRWIAYLDVDALWLIRRDGHHERRLAEGAIKSLAWSTDSTQIAYDLYQTGGPEDAEVYIWDFTSGQARRLLPDTLSSFYPTWSPDGEWIVFVCGFSNGSQDICRVRTDGDDFQNLTHTPTAYETAPQWSRDGQWLYVRDLVKGTLVRMRPDGSEYQVVSSDRGLSVADATFSPPIDFDWRWQFLVGIGSIFLLGGVILVGKKHGE